MLLYSPRIMFGRCYLISCSTISKCSYVSPPGDLNTLLWTSGSHQAPQTPLPHCPHSGQPNRSYAGSASLACHSRAPPAPGGALHLLSSLTSALTFCRKNMDLVRFARVVLLILDLDFLDLKDEAERTFSKGKPFSKKLAEELQRIHRTGFDGVPPPKARVGLGGKCQ